MNTRQVRFLFAILFGIVDSSTVPVTASLAASHIGIRVMGQAMGMISAGHSLYSALAAFHGGYLRDTTGSYEMLWPGSICLLAGASVFALLMLVMKPASAAILA